MKLKSYVVIALIALVSSVALAAAVSVTWQNATTNTDGSAIPASGPGSLVNTQTEYGPCNAAQTALASVTGTLTVPASATAGQIDLPPGTWCGHAKHTNTYGEVSDWTAVKVKAVAAPKPNPPSNFSFN